jgi:hypothetical protein
MNIFRSLKFLMLLLALPLAATASQAPSSSASQSKHDISPLIDKVRAATARYRNINVALAEGFAQATPCVSGPDFGAMGVHYVLGSRITGGVLQADEPEALIYEPLPDGAQRLVGVEFIVLASVWQSQHKDGSTPALDGHLLNYVAAPNRFGLPEFYEMHVWAWEQNPVGSFADWNSQVSCDKQPD